MVQGEQSVMSHLEIILFWTTSFLYVAAFCAHLFSMVRNRPRGISAAYAILLAAFAIHTALLAARWIGGGHIPVADKYELDISGTWLSMAVFLGFERWRKVDRAVGLVIVPITFLVLGYAITSRTDAAPMGPSYHSPWLIVHVLFAWLAFGCFAVAAGAAFFLLFRARFVKKPAFRRLPSKDELDLNSYRFIVLGLINHAIMLVSGSIWANKLWGHYWSWDPLEIWSLLTFLFYSFYLHARGFFGWKLEKAAWLAAFGLIILSISFWGVSWFAPSLHPGP